MTSADHPRHPRGSRTVLLDVVAAAIVDDLDAPTRVLAARRTYPPQLAGGWELPGGKVEKGESATAALRRELAEELGVSVVLGARVDGPLTRGRWSLSERSVMTVYLARVLAGRPRPLQDHDELRWLDRESLFSVPWLAGDLPVVGSLEAGLLARVVRGSRKA